MVMKWATSIYGPDNLSENEEGLTLAIQTCAKEIKSKISDHPITFLTGFVSTHFKSLYEKIPGLIGEALNPEVFIGCSAGGLIGGDSRPFHFQYRCVYSWA